MSNLPLSVDEFAAFIASGQLGSPPERTRLLAEQTVEGASAVVKRNVVFILDNFYLSQVSPDEFFRRQINVEQRPVWFKRIVHPKVQHDSASLDAFQRVKVFMDALQWKTSLIKGELAFWNTEWEEHDTQCRLRTLTLSNVS